MPNEFPQQISFNEKELPSAKDWKIGGRYQIVIEVEQTGVNVIERGDYEASQNQYTFKILSAEPKRQPY